MMMLTWRATLGLNGCEVMRIVESYLRGRGVRFKVKYFRVGGRVRIATYKVGLLSRIVIHVYPFDECDVEIPAKFRDLIELLRPYEKVPVPRVESLEEKYVRAVIDYNDKVKTLREYSLGLLFLCCIMLVLIVGVSIAVPIGWGVVVFSALMCLLPFAPPKYGGLPAVFAYYYYRKVKKALAKVQELEELNPSLKEGTDKEDPSKAFFYLKLGTVLWLVCIFLTLCLGVVCLLKS